MRVIQDGKISLDNLRHALILDPYFGPIIGRIKSGAQFQRYKLVSDILLRVSNEAEMKVCLPESLLEHAFFIEHYTVFGQHRTATQIARTLAKSYYAPYMLSCFRQLANRCYFCITNTPNTATAHPLKSDMVAERPREVWSFDIASGFTQTQSKHNNIHLFVDNFSLYTILNPSDSKSAESIIRSISTQIIQPFTSPIAIRSDGESGLIKAESAREFAAAHGIRFLPTAPASPFSNGLAEGRIKVVKSLIRSNLAAGLSSEWDSNIYLLQASLNQTVGSNGYSPEEVMFGFRNVRPNDLLTLTERPMDEHQYMNKLVENLRLMYDVVRNSRATHRTRNDNYRNIRTKERKFLPNQLVWALTKLITGQSGLICRKRGPYLIESISEHNQTAILREVSTNKLVKRHFAHLLPADEPRMTPRLNSNWDAEFRAFIHPKPPGAEKKD